MAMPTQRPRSSLHNFSLPCLKWGNQRQLRCVNVDDERTTGGSPSSSSKQGVAQNPPEPNGKRCFSERENFQRSSPSNFPTEVERLKFAVPSEGSDEIEPLATEARPWNLRTRRAVCKEPPRAGVKSPARRSDIDFGKRRAKFCVHLTKQEMEDDFIAMTGTRPPRKPKKRPRSVQRQIDGLFPAFWLSEVKPWMYKVNENTDNGKK